MAKRGKYGFEKRLKELKKKKKREEKLERKRLKKQDAQMDSDDTEETPAEATGAGLSPERASVRAESKETASADGEPDEREDR